MSLTHESDDLCSVQTRINDNRDVYAYNADNVPYFRPQPTLYAQGVFNNTINNGAALVDLETLLRNQQMISSRCPAYRAKADACLAPWMRAQALPCSRVELVPQTTLVKRSCDPDGERTIDRFDFLSFPEQGYTKGYAWHPTDTRQQLKDQLAKTSPYSSTTCGVAVVVQPKNAAAAGLYRR